MNIEIELLNSKSFVTFHYNKRSSKWKLSVNEKSVPDYFGYHRFKYSLTHIGIKKTK